MDYFPIFLRIRNRGCLVVGGGAVATRKVRQLRKAGARIDIVASGLDPALQALLRAGQCRRAGDSFKSSQVRGCALVIAASADRHVNRRVFEVCRYRGIPINAVDDPASCTYITPALVDRSPLLTAG
ncbi:MAG TPA: bifunctional precorrin-2 dehydrogenase/sirohydrochlorin ferrochelatase [Gammaproteobacteria bacterium]|nr:bifunctional precorrin-2 dehydrogenase/sirohydrochlorin ferrochelatase [Gammaproteobacteria bacterium]